MSTVAPTMRDELSSMLDDTPAGESDLEILELQGGKNHASPTALKLDDWSLRRGAEVFNASERIKEMYEIPDEASGDRWSASDREKISAAELATADFHAAAFEPEPELAQHCKNERISRYMKNLMETPEFQALHSETMLDEMSSEIAAASFSEGWVAMVAQEEPADEFAKDMQCLKFAGQSLNEATEEIGELRDAQMAAGIGCGGESKLTPAEMKNAFKRVKDSEMLKRICQLAGRYRRFAQAQQRKKVMHGRDDVVGVELAGDLGRILPQELLALGDPDLELEAMRKLVEGQMFCREFRGLEGQAKGPIVVVVDESGSMDGMPIYTAKAMSLALYWIARHQKRWCCLVGFSGTSTGNYLVIPPNSPNAEAMFDWLEHFYGGGTVCDVPLIELPSKWEALGCPKGKTDIICITDCGLSVPEETEKSFKAWKEREQVKLITIALGCDAGDMGLVSDKTHSVQSLGLEEDAVAEALSI